jgi:uncharacterized membrane protein YgcG
MKRQCLQCGRDFNGTSKNGVCHQCRILNDEIPIPPGATRTNSQHFAQPQNLPRYSGKIAENLIQCATAAIMMEAATAGLTPDGSGAMSDCFSSGGGDFGGGGAGGSW